MAYIKIREELGDRVYDQVLALANPETGVALVKASEVRAMIGCGKYEDRHILKALEYLVEDKKLDYISNNGMAGAKYHVPALSKGNTVTKHIEPEKPKDTLRDREKERLGLKKPAFEHIGSIATPLEAAKVSDIKATPDLQTAVADAEYVLSECPELIGKVFSQFLKTRAALDNLVREVKKNG